MTPLEKELKDALAVIFHSLVVADDKESDAPMSAWAHRDEARRIAEMYATDPIPPENYGEIRRKVRQVGYL